MRFWASSLIWYLIPKSSTTRVNIIIFLLWIHNTGVIGAGSYSNGKRCSLRAVFCNNVRLDYPIHSLFRPNIEKAFDLLIHEVLLINYFFGGQAGYDLVVLMLRHWSVELEVIEFYH